MKKIDDKAKKFWEWYQRYTFEDALYVARVDFWSAMNFRISSVLPLVLLIAFANLLPPESYGVYRYLLSLASSLGFLITTGMFLSVSRAVAKGFDAAFTRGVSIQLRSNSLFLLAVSIIGIYYLIKGNFYFAAGLFILGATAPMFSAFNTYKAYLNGKKENRIKAVYSICANLFYILIILITLFLTDNPVILIAAYAFSKASAAFYFFHRTVKIFRPETSQKPTRQIKKIIKQGKHLSFVTILATVSLYLDKILIFHFLGPVQLAIYYFAAAIPERISGYSKNLFSRFLPKWRKTSLKNMREIFLNRVFKAMFFGLVLSIIYIILAPLFFRIFLPKYINSVFYSQLLALSFIFIIPTRYMAEISREQKLFQSLYLSDITAHLARIVLFLTFGTLWGILGIILSSLIIYMLVLFYNLFLWEIEISSHLGIFKNDKSSLN